MTYFKLSALALATTLALTGCGDDDNDSNSNNGGGDVIPNVPELDQAKEMVRTAKLFVSDNYAVETAYENTADLLTPLQNERFDNAFDVPDDIFKYMQAKNLTTLTGSDIIALADDVYFNDTLSHYKLSPESDFIAKIDTDGHFTLSGSTLITENENYYDGSNTAVDSYTSSYTGYEDNSASLGSSVDHVGNFTFDTIVIGAGDDAVKLSAGKYGLKVAGKFNKDLVVEDAFELDKDELEAQGIVLEKAVYTLDSFKLEANDAVIEAKDFELSFLDIERTLANGTKSYRSLPYTLKLTGDIEKDSPQTDAAITLNIVADEEDARNHIILDNADNFVEADNEYVDMTVLLSVKGDVTKDSGTVIPLDFQANLKRTARDVITLENLTASVEGKTLYVTGQTNLDSNYDSTSSTLKVEQNGAHLTLNVDADGDFITDANNKLGDIMVNDNDYGDLFDNDGQVTAVFSDNSTIVL